MWNSKTVHQGWTDIRLGFMICFAPKKLRSITALNLKIAAYLTGRSTSHWAQYAQMKPYQSRQKAVKSFMPFIPLFMTKFNSLVELSPNSPEEIALANYVQLGSHIVPANRYVKCINLLTPSLVYWFHNGRLTLPHWVPSDNLFNTKFGQMLKEAQQHNQEKKSSFFQRSSNAV